MDAESVKQFLGGSGEGSGVPVEHMDYDYISNSSSIKELEKILKALRSGKEGIYPDLIRHCEERIGELNPKSKLLRKDKRPATEHDLGKEEWQRVHSDVKSFVDQAQATDRTMNQEDREDEADLPIRGSVTIDASGQKENATHEPDYKPSKDRIPSSDYASWDKYDVEKEVDRVDEAPETKEARRQAQHLNASRSAGVQEKLKTEGCSAKELEMRANREKDKGNEAFRAGDYSEAIVYYTRSLSVIPSAPAFNNRALARIRLEQFPSAVGDCNKVLELEPDNLKAMLRRGTARKSLHQYEEAAKDLEYVLSVEPGNKQAKDLLKDVKKKMSAKASTSTIPNGHSKSAPKGGKRMTIEEVEGSDSSEGDDDAPDGNIPTRRKSPEGMETKPQVNGEGTETGKPVEKGGATGKVTAGVTREGREGNGAVDPGPGVTQTSQSQSKEVATEGVQTVVAEEAPKPPKVEVQAKDLPAKVVKLKDEGTQLYKNGQYGNAKEKYSMALGILEEDKASYQSAIASLYSNRSACQLKLGDSQGCIADCELSLELSPYNVKVYLRRGSAYETLERYNHAYLDYQQALNLDHYNTTAQAAATRVVKVLQDQYGPSWREKLPARTLISAPRAQQPLSVLTRENGPTEVSTDGNVVVNAAAPTREKVTEEATKEGEEKTSSKEEQFQKLKAEGNDFVKKGDYNEAVKCYTVCTEIDPGQAVPFTNRALCYLKLNQHEKAEADCSEAIKLDPKNVKGLYRRALARKGLGNYFDSIKDLSTLLKLEPSNTSAKKELEIVKDSWRKELREKQQKPPENNLGNDQVGNAKKKSVLIEEAESDSEEEKDEKHVTPEKKPSGKKTPDSRDKESIKNGRNEGKPTEKHKNHRTKSKKEEKDSRNSKTTQSAQAPKLNKVTAYEFIQAWMSLKSTKDSLPYAQLLRQVPPDQLPTVLSNKLDAPMLTMILKAVEDHLVKSDAEGSYKLLSNLCKAQRFQTVILFMTNEQKQGIDKCLASLAAKENQFCSNDDIEKLRKSFGLIS